MLRGCSVGRRRKRFCCRGVRVVQFNYIDDNGGVRSITWLKAETHTSKPAPKYQLQGPESDRV